MHFVCFLKKELQSRTDLRNTLIFTIDPTSAKDLDDAVSCSVLSSGNFQVGVHIADVSYFVKPGSLLDKVAWSRAVSVYLPHMVSYSF